jgi:hypothetical protein
MNGKTREKWELFLFGKRRNMNLLEGFQVLSARPSDITIIKMKTQASEW